LKKIKKHFSIILVKYLKGVLIRYYFNVNIE
jgi:hypothetical protein